MKNLLCIFLLFFSFHTNTFANGNERNVSDSAFTFNVIPSAGPEAVEFEFLLKNEGEIPLNLEFPTSQLFDITVTDKSGNEVYRYSKGRYFLQAFQTIKIEPKTSYKRIAVWDYMVDGKRVPAGEYNAHITLKPVSLNEEPISNREKLTIHKTIIIPEENPVFRHVKVAGNRGKYKIMGETKPSKGNFYYTVEDGHREFVKETQINIGQKTEVWKPFTIQVQISETKLPEHGSFILFLYERDHENKIMNSFPVVLEKFYQ
ncbi:hypothetical protein E2K98_26405 [Bacillus salipaludis]|uniref:Intracellular proteinase inhibitor BsuPI domain-containing protein n=1 Tax=Bacillus salipaludis TaxID=2547811 RepID=A0A4R5VIX2_9BACI|nr:BsuPI-related putative proteinase inhibitor [Bacillus salipaludis]MDQ6596516.1 BsuPI-related putative proteinase inhibitor [Bacillus salipaludis]TDK57083.1 hypothetical protein E2K98_26405 [Bacillus salipaludis]